MFNKLKQIRDLRLKAKEIQSTLSKEKVEGYAVGGRITVILDGNHKIQDVKIEPELLTPENKEQLENAIKEAYEDASKKLQEIVMKKMISGKIEIPNLE